MNTLFILHGGNTTAVHPENDILFRYFTHFVEKDEVKILVCYFAKKKETWEKRMEEDKQRIEKQTTKKVNVMLAEDPEDLLKKLEVCDVLYVAGGDSEPIEAALPALKSLKEKLEGKVYIGCSMGAFIVSKNYVLSMEEQNEQEVHHGLGLLNLNTLCHFDVEKKKEFKIELLKKEDPGTPILCLDGCKFSIFIQ